MSIRGNSQNCENAGKYGQKEQSFVGQGESVLIQRKNYMSVRARFPKHLLLLPLLAFCATVFGQSTNGLSPSGGQFSILGSIPGDQVWPSISLAGSVGCITWYDSVIGKTVPSIGGAMLNNGVESGPIFRVNNVRPPATKAPQMPKVQLLANSDTIFVWQSAALGSYDIYARWARGAKNSDTYGSVFYTGDVRINTYLAGAQIEPAVAALPDGSALITWASWGQDGNMFGIYARKMLEKGRGATPKEFLVNQYTTSNQRNPAVAALAGGGYVIAWISEQERGSTNVDVYARVFSSDGVPQTDEIPVNSGTYPCDTPAVAPLNDGGFTVVWAQKDVVTLTNGWDIWGRAFTASGSPEGADFLINTYRLGDQYQPKIAAGAAGDMVVWTSLGEDGSWEGVYGRFLQGGTQPAGNEMLVNTTTISKQMHQDVAWDGMGHFLVVWTSFNGATGFDLFGQSYVVTSQ